jgi:hypothetical protein
MRAVAATRDDDVAKRASTVALTGVKTGGKTYFCDKDGTPGALNCRKNLSYLLVATSGADDRKIEVAEFVRIPKGQVGFGHAASRFPPCPW